MRKAACRAPYAYVQRLPGRMVARRVSRSISFLGVPVSGGFIDVRTNFRSAPAFVPYKGAVLPYVVSFSPQSQINFVGFA